MTPPTSDPDLRLSHADLPTLSAAWLGAITSLRDVAAATDDEGWARATECPAWTVGDVVAHVTAVECDMAGRPDTHEPDWDALPHVGDNLFARFTEVGVDARRGRPRQDVVAELTAVIAEREAQLAEAPTDADTPSRGPGGLPRTWREEVRMRTFDTWSHLQDVRRALGRPGDLATAAAWVSADRLVAALLFVVGKQVAPPPGTSVRVEVSGPVSFVRTVLVGDDGRAGFVPNGEVAEPTTTLATDWVTYERLGCGRIDPATAPVDITGDADLGARVVASLAITP